jgi:hypothetical protein
VKPTLFLILASALATPSTFKISVAIGGETITECMDVTVTGRTKEEADEIFGKVTASAGARVLSGTCSAEEKKLKLAALGSCFYAQEKDGGRFEARAWAYDPESTFGDGGYKSQCEGSWKSTPAGVIAESKVKAAEAELKRVAALPKETAEQIADDYEANEVAADKKYKGTVFFVTGRVQSVKRDHQKRVYVQVAGGNQFIGVHLYVKNDKFTGSLEPGEFVELECKGLGKGAFGAPSFDCGG